ITAKVPPSLRASSIWRPLAPLSALAKSTSASCRAGSVSSNFNSSSSALPASERSASRLRSFSSCFNDLCLFNSSPSLADRKSASVASSDLSKSIALLTPSEACATNALQNAVRARTRPISRSGSMTPVPNVVGAGLGEAPSAEARGVHPSASNNEIAVTVVKAGAKLRSIRTSLTFAVRPLERSAQRQTRRVGGPLIERTFDAGPATSVRRNRREIRPQPRARHAVRVVDQSLPRLLPRLRLLLRAADAHVSRAGRHHRMGLDHLRQAQRGPGLAARTGRAELARRRSCARNCHRPVSPRRRYVSHHPGDPRGTRARTNAGAHRDALAARRARRRRLARPLARGRGQRLLQHSDDRGGPRALDRAHGRAAGATLARARNALDGRPARWRRPRSSASGSDRQRRPTARGLPRRPRRGRQLRLDRRAPSRRSRT